MRRPGLLHAAAALAVAISLPQAACAAGLELGASLDTVRVAYPDAQLKGVDGQGPRLELKDIDYAGLHWGKLAFVFDDQRRLQAVKLTTKSETLEAVQGVVMAQMQALDSGLIPAADESPDTLQIRVCESSDSGVTLTLEHISQET